MILTLQIQGVKHIERESHGSGKNPFPLEFSVHLLQLFLYIKYVLFSTQYQTEEKNPTLWNRIGWHLGWIDKITLKK